MNWVFLGFVASVVFGVVWTARRERGAGETTRQGPVPGYSFTPGAAFATPEVDLTLERGTQWRPESIETFHSPNRSRIVLRIDIDPCVEEPALRRFAELCAREVGLRSHARVVLLELLTSGKARSWYLWTADALGWTGQQSVDDVYIAADELPA